jgi:alpha-1,3-rhamnosyl/mannosyltransferase
MEPRKNLQLILRAMAEAKPGSPLATMPLVCAGWSGWLNDTFDAFATASGTRARIHAIGRVSDTDLIALYRAATVFVYPSHYEGFGLPVLEAMACGCPVVISTDPALVEVAGGSGAAPAVAPDDPAALADAVNPLLEDAALRQQRVAAGFARAAEFSWARTARETLSVLRAVANHGGA